MDNHNRYVFQNIVSGWKLDAMLEDSKYFFFFDEVRSIANEQKCYVIGRKGSGKSAICQHLDKQGKYNVFSRRLSFKNFPFNKLYTMQDVSYNPPNQYTTFWKYVIYSKICQMMVENNNLSSSIRTELERYFPKNELQSLDQQFSYWTKLRFGFEHLGNGATLDLGRNTETKQPLWLDNVEILENVIKENIDDAYYYILFDELDENYRDIHRDDFTTYIELITGLFKAVQNVKSIFMNIRQIHIIPVVFLRDDIYSHIEDSDKNKWSDLTIKLDWSIDKIKQMLAFRISQDRAEPQYRKGDANFNLIWDSLFSTDLIRYGSGKRKTSKIFVYMCKSTLLRPRDFIRFIIDCCQKVLDQNKIFITPSIVIHADRAFSNYFKQEFIDELTPLLPDVKKIFDLLSNQRQWIITQDKFRKEYALEVLSGRIKDDRVDYVLETLFEFSVIGLVNKNREDVKYFKYKETNMRFNKKENFVIHRGLFKALGIV